MKKMKPVVIDEAGFGICRVIHEKNIYNSRRAGEVFLENESIVPTALSGLLAVFDNGDESARLHDWAQLRCFALSHW